MSLSTMKKRTMLLAEEIIVGGLEVEDSKGRKIEVPEVRIEDQMLTLSIEVQSIEQAQQTAQEGLQELCEIQPPEDLKPVYEQLVNAYEGMLPAYENIIEAFRGEDMGALAAAVQESMPEFEQASAEARSILKNFKVPKRRGSSNYAAGEEFL